MMNQKEKKIQNLQSQLQSLQQKIMQLEHNKNILRKTNLNVFSEEPKIDFKPLSSSQQYNNYL